MKVFEEHFRRSSSSELDGVLLAEEEETISNPIGTGILRSAYQDLGLTSRLTRMVIA
jgi:hypothetical protein